MGGRENRKGRGEREKGEKGGGGGDTGTLTSCSAVWTLVFVSACDDWWTHTRQVLKAQFGLLRADL